ncbi:mannosyltransferase [Saccharomycopsis crataegensis]|uniref:Mannosyltransferase n=1 Tax=Saccharomycopsis crataegensis TaxID=43959 RepID=A0AAV5QRD7_9ASCO|nr:mannosyltransferase [Saccharomycopsis crataegensis]
MSRTKAFLIILSIFMTILTTGWNCRVRPNSNESNYATKLEDILDQIKSYEQQVQLRANNIQTILNRQKIKHGTNAYYSNDERNLEFVKNFQETHTNLQHENATILMLVRNWELEGALKSMRSLEDRFNHLYKYTWTFLNDVPFTDEFKEATTLMASGKTQYGLIPSEDWDRPSWINETKFEENLLNSEKNGVLYGNSRSYRNMCRFNSGYFYKQKLLDQYQWYFRVEPDVEYFCDFQYDPFKLMRENNKKYGFVISIYEYENTIPTLWNTTKQFMEQYPQHIHPNNSLEFITNTSPIGSKALAIQSESDYNLCHFWSNFEIANLDFFRSKAYNDYFDFLEKTGGFYYERWGDAPVHSIGVALLLARDEIHHFEDIGYIHAPFESCPTSRYTRLNKRCVCDPYKEANIDMTLHSCVPKWWKFGAGKKFMNE